MLRVIVSNPSLLQTASLHQHHHNYTNKKRVSGTLVLIHANSINARSKTYTSSVGTGASSAGGGDLSLLHSYARAGLLRDAVAIFNAMPERTLVSYTILMSGFTLHGPAVEALSLFHDILREPSVMVPDPFVFSVVLRACTSTGSLNHGRELHCYILKMGFMEDLFVANALVTMYAGCREPWDSSRVFWGIREPDLVSWSSLLSGFVQNGHNNEALRLFGEMGSAGIRFDVFVFSIALKASANIGSTESGIQIHCYMIKMGLERYMFLANCLMEFYSKTGRVDAMRQVFDEMLDKELASWNTTIAGYTHNCCEGEALSLFRALMHTDAKCDDYTLGSIFGAVAVLGALNHGKEIHCYAIRAGFEANGHVHSALIDMYIECTSHGRFDSRTDFIPLRLFIHLLSVGVELDEFIIASMLRYCALQLDLETGEIIHSYVVKLEMKLDPFVVSSLIDMYAKCGILEASRIVFAGIESPDTVSWSAVIAGHCYHGCFREALQLFRQMQVNHVKANEFTYTAAIMACTGLKHLNTGKEIHGNVIRNTFGSNASVCRSLIHLYTEQQQLQQALKLCSLTCNSEILQSSLIQAFARVNDHESILRLFHKIQRSYGRLDEESARAVLNSCSSPLQLNAGLQAHAYITKRGLISEPNFSNSLIKMYSKCGTLQNAVDAFNQISKKTSHSWTSFISANVDHGCPKKALQLFAQMRRKEQYPDSTTFVSVLKACGETGMVEEAFRIFVSMSEVYKINPSAEHYCCIIEVLSQAGMISEAEHFIDRVIPFKPTASVWRTLLFSSQQHGNAKYARYAAEKLVELEPEDSSANALLRQMLLTSGDWSDALKLT